MATIKFSYRSIDAFYPRKEQWNPFTYEYYRNARDVLNSSSLSLSKRVQKAICALKKAGIKEIISPRCGAAGYYYTYSGFAVQLDLVTEDLLKELLPLCMHCDVLREYKFGGQGIGIMQFVFKYKINRTDRLISCTDWIHSSPSWMKMVKWAEKLGVIELK